ncbi:hypothetical protein EV186_101520 [Labedaea rhizosphaerae]|uniref:Uncharacterized protein n=2 Tax=Labedaea rhizosphaerae TaxID=598644 RepID=A0A4R6SKC7_LABRH|nr:hypothetical protein EV186_101520 [Labedaea rhizosphaerae]
MQPYPPQQPPGGGGEPWPQQPPRPPVQVPFQYGQAPVPPKRKAPFVVAGIAIAVVLGVIAFVVVNNDHRSPVEWAKAQPSQAVAGDCIKVISASTTDARVEKVDCTSPDAVFKVGTKMDGTHEQCPSDSYDTYTQSGRGDEFTLCLMLNAVEGDCFSHVSSGTTAKVACTAADAEARADKVVNGEAAESACPADTGLTLVYPEPGETLCLNEVTGT